jgi:cob(I)alamin adenosyltransferase
MARAQCRRAEIEVLRLRETEEVNRSIAVYLNRLSDLLFVLARVCNLDRGDVLWQPGGADR